MLEIKDLSIRSGETQLVKNISVNISRGEVFSIVGESGSGKSLTCLAVMSLLQENLVSEGEIIFTHRDGKSVDLLKINKDERRTYALKKIAYVFQEPLSALNPVQTCGQQLIENIALCGIKGKHSQNEKAKQLLDEVELNDTLKIMHSYPFQLSGGQRQRIMIAMAMAGNPDLIIADEPTTALDVLLQDEILGLLKKLCKEHGRSILLVSHDLDAVKKFSDRIAVMYAGEIVERGETNTIISHPEHAYTIALLACKPSPDKKGKHLLTLSDSIEGNGNSPKMFASETVEDTVVAELKHTGKIFTSAGKKQEALKDIGFKLLKGSSTGLIGESGSGKSTIARIMVALEDKSSGEVIYDFKNSKPLTSNIQMVFQDPFAALNPSLSVQSMLIEVLRKHSNLNAAVARREAEELLVKVGLRADDLKKYPNEFSGGQRQRLCIARALAAKPLLLICDESTSALDLSVQAQILNLLKELQISEKLTLLMVTHSMAVASWFCNFLIVLKNGKIVEQGKTEDLIENPEHPYTKAMVDHI